MIEIRLKGLKLFFGKNNSEENFTVFTGNGNGAAMCFTDRFGNCQSKPIMTAFTVPCMIQAVEAFKDMCLLISRDFLSVVFYRQNDVFSIFQKGETDFMPVIGMSDRIIQQN